MYKKKEDPNWKKTEKERKRFLDKLKIAIDVAGGIADNRWDSIPLDIAFSQLLNNGIEINFELTEKFSRKKMEKYRSMCKAFNERVGSGKGDNVVLFLYPKLKEKES